MKRLALYTLLVTISASIYILWRNDYLPEAFSRFMGNYGLHGLGTFGYTLFLGAASFSLIKSKLYLFSIIGLAFVVSLGNEFIQIFQPERVFSGLDILMQVIGCLIAYGTILLIGPITFKKST